jgi:hypothetical protein
MFLEFEFNKKLKKRCFDDQHRNFSFLLKSAKNAFGLKKESLCLYYIEDGRKIAIVDSKDVEVMLQTTKPEDNYFRVHILKQSPKKSVSTFNPTLKVKYYIEKLRDKFKTRESTKEEEFTIALHKIHNHMRMTGINSTDSELLLAEVHRRFQIELIEALLEIETDDLAIKNKKIMIENFQKLNISVSTINSSKYHDDSKLISFEQSHFLLNQHTYEYKNNNIPEIDSILENEEEYDRKDFSGDSSEKISGKDG